jgi:serine/threonine protein kinase
MVTLAQLVHIANNAKTNSQKNAVGEEVKKLLRGKEDGAAKACYPEKHFFTRIQQRPLLINKATRLRAIGKGQYGTVFYGCIDDKCATQVAIKVTTEESAKMEYRIAEKLKGMGTPRMYHFKSCRFADVLYFEYIDGKSLQAWIKTKPSEAAVKKVIGQLIQNLANIHKKYPKFRHHDLHANNLLILRKKDGFKPVIIDFGMSTMEGVRNPIVTSGELAEEHGIGSKSHIMYDAHFILNSLFYEMMNYSGYKQTKEFLRDILPEEYRGVQGIRDVTMKPTNFGKYVNNYRMVLGAKHNFPTYETILKHPFLSTTTKTKKNILKKVLPPTKQKVVVAPRPPQPPVRKGSANQSSAIRRAVAVLQKNAEKKKVPLKRPGIARVKSVEKKAPKTAVAKPKISINKNGDTKIDRRKCRLYKKDELVKKFKLDPTLTKDEMCKKILAMK